MSEHRRKPPQGRGRRAAQQPQQPSQQPRPPQSPQPPPPQSPQPGYGPPPPREATTRSYGQGYGGQGYSAQGAPGDRAAYGGRAEARRAAQRGAGGGRRRAGAAGAGAAAAGGRAAARERARAAQMSDRKRFIDYPRSGKYGVKRWMPSWKQVLGTCVAFTGMMMGLAGIAYAMVEVPDPNKTATSQKNVYYWSNGDRMVTAGGGDQNRQIIDLGQIPQSMQDAVISAENESFYQDSGIDPVGIARAAVRMAMGGQTQSGSTITQQYVKNTYLNQDQTLGRKAKELLISIKVDATKEKDYILAGYLNTAYYGRGAYGIQAAAHAYYRKDAKDLTPSQSAFLASLLNGPNLYDPYGGEGGGPAQSKKANTERAKSRWKWILGREVETGMMKESVRNDAVAKGFPNPKPPETATNLKGQIGYLVNLANQDILSAPDSGITEKELQGGGYQIHTTFDEKKVNALQKTIEGVKKKNLDPKKRDEDKYVQFGGASVKPDDGAIVAIYGGESATTHYMNNANFTGASVGSTFKPFVMAAAMRDGVRDPDGLEDQGPEDRTPVSPKSMYNGDNKIKLLEYDGDTWLNKDGEEWHQKNDGGEDHGDITLREAMRVSANTPFIQLGMDVGLDRVKKAAIDAGLRDDESMAGLTPTFSLGTSAPSAIRLSTGYATFANSGLKAEPYSVTEVKDGAKIEYRHEKQPERAFDSDVADNVTSMLETVVEKGTGTRAKELGRPAAGKTGTTDDNKTAWFSGYTPQLSTSIGMWRMNDQKTGEGFLSMNGTAGLPQIHGADFPAEVWTDYMTEAMKGLPQESFPEAEPIGEKVCSHASCPSPSPTPSPSEEPSEGPSEIPSETAQPSEPTPSPSETCRFGFDCDDEGTTTGPGGDTGGTDTGGTDGGTDSGTTGDPGGDTGGSDSGGLFEGSSNGNGGRPEDE